MTLLDTALRPTAGCWGDEGLMMASLDHAMWFHRPFRADEWLLYDQDTPSASGGRGLGRGSIFTADGPPRGHGRAGGPDPGGPPMRRAAVAGRSPSCAARRVQRRRPRGPEHDHDHHDDGPAQRLDGHHRPAGGADPRQRSRSRSRRSPSSTSRSRWRPGPARPTCTSPRRAGGSGSSKVEHGRVRRRRGRAHLPGPDHAAARHLRRGHQRGRAGPARHGLLQRRPQAVPRLHPPARRPHRRRRVHARRPARRSTTTPAASCSSSSSPSPTTTAASSSIGPGRLPLHRASATAATAATPSGTGRTPPPCSARSCASTPRAAPRTAPPTPSRPATRSPTATAARPRSGSTASATRGGSRFDTDDRRPLGGRRRPGRVRGDQPAARRGGLRRGPGRQPRMGPRWRAPTPSTAARTPTAACCRSIEYGRDHGVLGHRRLRVPRRGDPRPPGRLPLRRLLRHRRPRPAGGRRHA